MTAKEFAKKIIASINPGKADISGIGDGTIKGAISELNSNIEATQSEISDANSNIQKLWEKVFPDTVSQQIDYSKSYAKTDGTVTAASFTFDTARALVGYAGFTVKFTNNSAAATSSVSYTLQGSNDGTNWSNIDTRSGTRGKYTSIYLLNNAKITFTGKTAYTKYRILVQSSDNEETIACSGKINFS